MFSDQLKAAIEANPDVNPYYSDKILHLLNSPDSLRKRVVLHWLESSAQKHLDAEGQGYGRLPDGSIDWSSVNWPAVLGVLLKVLVALLPLLML